MAIKAKRGDLLDVTKKAPLEAPVPMSKEFAGTADDFDKDSYGYPQAGPTDVRVEEPISVRTVTDGTKKDK